MYRLPGSRKRSIVSSAAEWKIDARFNRDELIFRIQAIAKMGIFTNAHAAGWPKVVDAVDALCDHRSEG